MSIYTFNPAKSINVGTEIPMGEEGIIYTVKAVRTLSDGSVVTTIHNDFSSDKKQQDGFDLTFNPTDKVLSCILF